MVSFQPKFLLPELLRKREHSGSSRDSGYSSYFGPQNSRNKSVPGGFLKQGLSHINDDLSVFGSNVINLPSSAQDVKALDCFQTLQEPSVPQNDINNGSFINSIQSLLNCNNVSDPSLTSQVINDSLPNTPNTMSGLYNAPLQANSLLNSVQNSSSVSLASQNGLSSFGNAQVAPKASIYDTVGFGNNGGIHLAGMDNNGLLSSLNNVKKQADADKLFQLREALKLNNLSQASAANNFLQFNASGSPNDALGNTVAASGSAGMRPQFGDHLNSFNTNNVLSGDTDDKLGQMVPTDPEGKKNFLDNLQLLTQLSNLTTTEDAEPSLLSSRASNNGISGGMNWQTGNVSTFNNGVPQNIMLQQATEQSMTRNSGGIMGNSNLDFEKGPLDMTNIHAAAELLNSCNTSSANNAASLNDLQMMIKRHAMQEAQARNLLTRNLGGGVGGNAKRVTDVPDAANISNLLSLNNSSIRQMLQNKYNGSINGKAQPSKIEETLWNSARDTSLSLENLEAVRNLNNYSAFQNSQNHQRFDSRMNGGLMNTHPVNNSLDNYKITSLSNGSYMTSKNCANFEKLTMHSPKDLPNQFNHLMAAAQSQSSLYSIQNKNTGFVTPSPTPQPNDLNTMIELSMSSFNGGSTPQFTAKQHRDFLSGHHHHLLLQQQQQQQQQKQCFSPDLFASSNSKAVSAEVLAAQQQKIAPELLAASSNNKGDFLSLRGGLVPPSHQLPMEYYRGVPPDLLHLQPNMMAYRQMG